MSIKDFVEKVKPLYWFVVIILVASIFFALGRLSAIESKKEPIRIYNSQKMTDQSASVIGAVSDISPNTEQNRAQTGGSEAVIGSKTGKKYYFPWCGGVKRIKPENQATFGSIEQARSAGYTPAGNCKGLK